MKTISSVYNNPEDTGFIYSFILIWAVQQPCEKSVTVPILDEKTEVH